jgi:S-DNA-T family DNA segregation ATPase FtsK/SpoIIIE
MAKRRGRKRKKKVTYDSKETITFLGLVFLVAGIFMSVSYLSSDPINDNIFTQARGVFGDATILTAGFLIIWGLKMLGMKISRIKRVHVIAQVFFLISFSGLLTALDQVSKKVVQLNGGSVTNGGEIGTQVVYDFFQDWTPASAPTVLILIVINALMFPVAFSVSPSKVGDGVKYVAEKIASLFKFLFGKIESGEKESKKAEDVPIEKASRFGDFNSFLKKPTEEKGSKNDQKEEKNSYNDNEIPAVVKKKSGNENSVDVKTSEIGEDGLSQDQLKFPDWKLPPLSLLAPFKKSKAKDPTIKQKADIIEQILESFKIEAKVEDSYIGPSVIQYALNIPLGVNVKKIASLGENLALALGVDAKAVRIESIPETTYLGIEVPRANRDLVRYKEMMSSEPMRETNQILPVPVGKDIHGEAIIAGVNKMPHLLVAGATGSGKSVLTNNFICSLIMNKTPDELKLILVDPKQVELMDYNGIPHLLTPVITDMELVVNALKWAVGEMEKRYSTLAKEQVRNIEGYNKKKGFAAMPYIVIVIDEMADMMMTANRVESENAIVRLAQKARAVGIHLILATQRPSVNVITGIIKANIPGRIGMSVTSATDSRVILDRIGAESLMGGGDLLYKAPDKTKASRLQCAFVEQEEIIRVVDFIKQQAPEIEYIADITERQVSDEEATQEALGEISGDNLVEQAIHLVVRSQKGSSSFLQRRLSIGFNRAARLLEELEEAGVVGPPNGSKPREVLVSDAEAFIQQLKASAQ